MTAPRFLTGPRPHHRKPPLITRLWKALTNPRTGPTTQLR